MKKTLRQNGFKFFIKLVLSVLVIVYIIFAPISVFPLLKKSQSKVNAKIQIDYMGILELWNIDTFEGGSKSRTSFLEKQAISFEKEHKGCYVMVYSISPEQAKINIENGQKPDMISFGIGVGEDIRQNLIKLNSNYNVRSDLLAGGKDKGNLYAVPYILGGYVLINDNNSQQNSKQADILGFGDNSFNNFSFALAHNNITFNSLFEQNQSIDSFNAYDKYLSKKFNSLCGTQRDLYRVLNRIEKGTMTERSFEYLQGFSDLIQYIGIGTDDEEKQEICQNFIQKLLSSEVQKSLSNYNLFSVNHSIIYDSQNEQFSAMEKTLSKPLKTIGVFTSNQDLIDIKKLSYEALKGNNDAKAKLKNYYA